MSDYSPIEDPAAVALALATGVIPLLGDRKRQLWHFSVSAELSPDGSLELTGLSWSGPGDRQGSLRAAFYPDWAVKKLRPAFADAQMTNTQSRGEAMNEADWTIEQYVKALNWLQGNIFEHYMDRETKEMRFKLAPHAMTLAKSLKGDSLFGAALRASNTEGDGK